MSLLVTEHLVVHGHLHVTLRHHGAKTITGKGRYQRRHH